MDLAAGVELDEGALGAFCARHHIRSLKLFGSALRDELRPDSDIDLLVEFDPQHTPGLLGVSAMEFELEKLIGRRVDLRTAADISRLFRDEVTANARLLYAAP